ncbi:MAG: hypothetical protein J0L56_17380 [Chitinophagales bacterium]|nr:hypothetical protein [Chitinophagales bacterium]
MAEEKFSPEQSLQLIQSMISRTKQNMSDNSIYFLIWGWLTFIAFIGQFMLKHVLQYEKHYMVWLVVIIGIIFSIYQGKKDEKKVRAKSWVDENMSHLWLGMGISFFVLSMIITRMGWGTEMYPFFIMMYGLGTFVSGNFLQFRPLITGGIIAWVLAIGSTWVSYDYQMLLAAAAILFSYIIPAYMLRRRDKINNQ